MDFTERRKYRIMRRRYREASRKERSALLGKAGWIILTHSLPLPYFARSITRIPPHFCIICSS